MASLKPKPEQTGLQLGGCVNEIMNHLQDLLSTDVDQLIEAHRSKFQEALMRQPPGCAGELQGNKGGQPTDLLSNANREQPETLRRNKHKHIDHTGNSSDDLCVAIWIVPAGDDSQNMRQ